MDSSTMFLRALNALSDSMQDDVILFVTMGAIK